MRSRSCLDLLSRTERKNLFDTRFLKLQGYQHLQLEESLGSKKCNNGPNMWKSALKLLKTFEKALRIECVRVDGATDEGPSHEVKFY